jgi:hypothetical protein
MGKRTQEQGAAEYESLGLFSYLIVLLSYDTILFYKKVRY